MKRNLLVLVLVGGIMALLIWSAVVTYRARRLAELNAPAHVTLTPAAPGGSETAGTVQEQDSGEMADFRGKPAPALKLNDLSGKPVDLAQLRGKAVLVNFWATWCAPCKIETPWIIALNKQYGPQGFVALGVSADESDTPKEEVAKSAKNLDIDYPVLFNGNSIAKQWGGLDALPTSFYIGRDGTVVEQTQGLYTREEMEANIKKALATGKAS